MTQLWLGVWHKARKEYFSNMPLNICRVSVIPPFRLKTDARLQKGLREPHQGLNGVFADSLSDGWGSLLQDRWFRRKGISLDQITQMDRLAFLQNAKDLRIRTFSRIL